MPATLLMYTRAILAAYGIWAGVPLDSQWILPLSGITQLWNDPAALVDACALRCLQWRSIARRLQRWWRRAILRKRSVIAAIVIQRAWRNHCPLSSYLSTLRATMKGIDVGIIQRARRDHYPSSSYLSTLRATIETNYDQVAVTFDFFLDVFAKQVSAPISTDRAGWVCLVVARMFP